MKKNQQLYVLNLSLFEKLHIKCLYFHWHLWKKVILTYTVIIAHHLLTFILAHSKLQAVRWQNWSECVKNMRSSKILMWEDDTGTHHWMPTYVNKNYSVLSHVGTYRYCDVRVAPLINCGFFDRLHRFIGSPLNTCNYTELPHIKACHGTQPILTLSYTVCLQ
jgi:hypothetical protein